MVNNQANIKAVITAEDQASGVIKKFGNNVDEAAQSNTKNLKASLIAAGAATAGIVAFGKRSLDAWNEQDLATVRLQTGINNVKSATDKHIDSLIKEASALQKTTRFSDEAYISAQGILSTFQLNQDAIAKLTPRLADMSEGLARVSGGMPDLEGNAILVAKAIGGEDTAGLVGALRRAGVVMTEHQQKLLQTGTVQERVSLITQVLDQNFAHMAEAAGGTTAGKVAILKNNFNDLEEKIGETIATALNPLLDVLNKHPVVLDLVTGSIIALTTAFIAAKVAVAATAVWDAAAGAIALVGAAATATTGALTALAASAAIPIVLAVGGAIADLYLLKQAANAAQGAIAAVNDAQRAADQLAPTAQMQQLHDQAKAATARGDTAAAQRYANAIKALGGSRAVGGPVTGGVPYLVGEKGPEIVVPNKNSTVIPNNKIGGGDNITIQVNAGMFMGSDVEARKTAQYIFDHLKDIAASKNVSVAKMLGV